MSDTVFSEFATVKKRVALTSWNQDVFKHEDAQNVVQKSNQEIHGCKCQSLVKKRSIKAKTQLLLKFA